MLRPTPVARHFWQIGLACLAFAGAGLLRSAEASRAFDIAAGDAALTLRRFAEQAEEQIVYPVERVRGVVTNPIRGSFAPRAALEQMLAGTSLRVVQDERSGALAIVRGAAPAPVNAKAPGPVRPPVVPVDELVHLNPFEVSSTPDNSYGALDSNSLTAFRMELHAMPATTHVFTSTFIDDVALSSVQDILANYAGTIGADPNNSGAALMMPGDRDGSGGGLGIRGLAVGMPKRDGFVGTRSLLRSPLGYTDAFSVERIEVIEGPQSLLYGAVGGGGVINLVSKRAQFAQQRGTFRTRLDPYGGKRAELDVNHGGERFALRIALAGEERRNVRYNLGNDFHGLYLQAAFKLGPQTTLRLLGERTANWGNVSFTPTPADLANFLPPGDPRRGQDTRFLALTGQLADLRGRLWDGPVDYNHISSFGAWWSSERIDGRFSGAVLETTFGGGLSAQVNVIYGETIDDRFTVGKNLVPAAGQAGAGANPFPFTAVRVTPGDNWQSDRTRGVRATLLHEANLRIGPWRARSQTALGFEATHQGPAFASSGIDRLYYQADANWNPIVSPTITTDYGRVPLGSFYFPVQGGIPLRPQFRPGARRIVFNGQNYLLEPRIRQDPARVSAENPAGIVPNNPTAANPNGFAGVWNRGADTRDRQWYLANVTDWAEGRLTTLAGANVDRFSSLNVGTGAGTTSVPARSYPGFMIGASARIDALPGARVYSLFSTAGLSAGTTKDFYGEPLRVPHARSALPEIGVKYESAGRRVAAQLAFTLATRVRDETRNVGVDFFNAVNPAGINGRHNSGDQWINVDREARAIELLLTANPTRDWRLRLSATQLGGEITSAVSYRQLYNDQFFERGGTVTYRDGTPLLVDPAGAAGARTAPLTLAMLNDPADLYFATPDPNSGRITNPLVIAALTAVDPVRGAAATGVTGLPIAAMQYAFANPHRGEVRVVSAGDKTTGINESSFNLQTAYRVPDGRWRGLGVFGDVRTQWRNRAYYTAYFPAAGGSAVQAERVLHRLPGATVLGLALSYERKFGPRLFSTRLNVNNALNHYRVWIVPSPTNGALLNARLSTQPRQWVWTASVSW